MVSAAKACDKRMVEKAAQSLSDRKYRPNFINRRNRSESPSKSEKNREEKSLRNFNAWPAGKSTKIETSELAFGVAAVQPRVSQNGSAPALSSEDLGLR